MFSVKNRRVNFGLKVQETISLYVRCSPLALTYQKPLKICFPILHKSFYCAVTIHKNLNLIDSF